MGRARFVVARDSKSRWLVIDTSERDRTGRIEGIVCGTRSEARRRALELNWQRASDNGNGVTHANDTQ